jgi:hypothetical protein
VSLLVDRIVREDGYDNRTRWRGALESELNNTLTLVKHPSRVDLKVAPLM